MEMEHKDLETSLANPEFVTTDWAKADRAIELHVAFRALYSMEEEEIDGSERNDFLSLCHEELKAVSNFEAVSPDEKVMSAIWKTKGDKPGPICAFLGGFVAQEVVKSLSGKYCPVTQWIYYDALEIPTFLLELLHNPEIRDWDDEEKKEKQQKEDEEENKDRYCGQRASLGVGLEKKLANAKVFVVGAGVST